MHMKPLVSPQTQNNRITTRRTQNKTPTRFSELAENFYLETNSIPPNQLIIILLDNRN